LCVCMQDIGEDDKDVVERRKRTQNISRNIKETDIYKGLG